MNIDWKETPMAPEDEAEIELNDDALSHAVGGATSISLNVAAPAVPDNAEIDATASVGVGGPNATVVVYSSTFVPFESSF